MIDLPSGISPGTIVAGCDEAGRGCLAGPVFAAAVILDGDCLIAGLNDSKQLTERQRMELRQEIEHKSVAWEVAQVEPQQIDKENILQASLSAMHMAISKLVRSPEMLLIDGNKFRPYPGIRHICIVKGDSRIRSIAAASILAKTHRDEYMLRLHEEYPEYGWDANKGYPTALHRRSILQYGITPHHRRSFKLLPDTQTELF